MFKNLSNDTHCLHPRDVGFFQNSLSYKFGIDQLNTHFENLCYIQK